MLLAAQPSVCSLVILLFSVMCSWFQYPSMDVWCYPWTVPSGCLCFATTARWTFCVTIWGMMVPLGFSYDSSVKCPRSIAITMHLWRRSQYHLLLSCTSTSTWWAPWLHHMDSLTSLFVWTRWPVGWKSFHSPTSLIPEPTVFSGNGSLSLVCCVTFWITGAPTSHQCCEHCSHHHWVSANTSPLPITLRVIDSCSDSIVLVRPLCKTTDFTILDGGTSIGSVWTSLLS